MKKHIVWALVFAACLATLSSAAVTIYNNQLATSRDGWYIARDAVATNDAAVDLTTALTIPSHAWPRKDVDNAIEIAVTGGADGQACTMTVYALKFVESDVSLVWTGTVTAGTQYKDADEVWCDTISGTDTWGTTISEVDAAGNNRRARLVFDTMGYDRFWIHLTGISSETFSVYTTGY